MHVVICGCGRVGSGLARTLEAEGHTVAIIDRFRKSFRRLPADFKGLTVIGSGFDRDVLSEARIDEADAFAAVTSGDNSNILAARIARETYGVERVVARIYDPQRAQVYQRLGIPTVATVTWTVDQVRSWLLPDEFTPRWRDASGSLLLIDRVLPEHFAGRKLATLEAEGKVRLIAVTRAGVPRLDTAALVGQDGDLLHLVVLKDELPALEQLLSPESVDRRSARMKVAVAGGGSVGMAVAADLKQHGHDVMILEVDPEQVARFQPHVDVRWTIADACEVSSLQAAGMSDVDVMVAATGDDEDNLVISLLSKQEFAVPRVIARVNNASNQWLFTESWGVDVPVSTPQLYTSLVEEAVSVGSLVHLMSFEGASAHLLEVTLAESSPACGMQIADLGLPREAAIVALVRREHMIIPDPETQLYPGDEVIVLAMVASEQAIQKILVG